MTILEILEAHQITKNPEQLYRSFRIACECGETFKGVDTYDATVSHRVHLAEVLEKHMQEREALALEHVAWTLTAKEVGDARRTVNNSPKYMGTIMEPVALILKRRAEKIRGR